MWSAVRDLGGLVGCSAAATLPAPLSRTLSPLADNAIGTPAPGYPHSWGSGLLRRGRNTRVPSVSKPQERFAAHAAGSVPIDRGFDELTLLTEPLRPRPRVLPRFDVEDVPPSLRVRRSAEPPTPSRHVSSSPCVQVGAGAGSRLGTSCRYEARSLTLTGAVVRRKRCRGGHEQRTAAAGRPLGVRPERSEAAPRAGRGGCGVTRRRRPVPRASAWSARERCARSRRPCASRR